MTQPNKHSERVNFQIPDSLHTDYIELQKPRLYRLRQIIGNRTNPGPIPISKSSWWSGVKSGKYPKPIHLGARTSVWRSEDIDKIIAGGE